MIQTYPFPDGTYRLVGKVTRAHGLKGELKIVFFSGDPESLKQYSRIALVAMDGRMTTPLEIVGARRQGRLIILKLDTIDTRQEAELTAGMGVLVAIDHAKPETDDGVLAPHRLTGLPVRTEGSTAALGVVVDFFDNGAQQIMVVDGDREEYLIPLIPQIVISVDAQGIVIDPPPGLLDINTVDPGRR